MQVNKFLVKKLDELEVKCRFFPHGCGFDSRLKDVWKHEARCQFACGVPTDDKENVQNPVEKEHCSDCKSKLVLCKYGCGRLLPIHTVRSHNCVAELLSETRKKESANANLITKLDIETDTKTRLTTELQETTLYYASEIKKLEEKLAEIVLATDRKNYQLEGTLSRLRTACEDTVGRYMNQQIDLLAQVTPDLQTNIDLLEAKFEDTFQILEKRHKEELSACNMRLNADTYSFTDSRPKPPKFISQFRPKNLSTTVARIRSQSCGTSKQK